MRHNHQLQIQNAIQKHDFFVLKISRLKEKFFEFLFFNTEIFLIFFW
jgi:hypothetical protein